MPQRVEQCILDVRNVALTTHTHQKDDHMSNIKHYHLLMSPVTFRCKSKPKNDYGS